MTATASSTASAPASGTTATGQSARRLRVLVWHVHGSWLTSLLHGNHDFLIPVLPDEGPYGRGLARTWDWTGSARAVTPAQLRQEDIDVVVLQRAHEVALVREWAGRSAGRDVPAVYVEHNTPGPAAFGTRHPLASRSDIPLVHVTPFNAVYWDNGRAPVCVIEHGVPDPGLRYSGELARIAVAVNDPIRRGRAVGTDLLPAMAAAGPMDVFGMNVRGLGTCLGLDADSLAEHDDPSQQRLHRELARRRVYAHTPRWTSLGLSLIEAMLLGLPVVALGATETWEAVPREAGVVSTNVERLVRGARQYLADPDAAAAAGTAGRAEALRRYGLRRFLADWDRLLMEVMT